MKAAKVCFISTNLRACAKNWQDGQMRLCGRDEDKRRYRKAGYSSPRSAEAPAATGRNFFIAHGLDKILIEHVSECVRKRYNLTSYLRTENFWVAHNRIPGRVWWRGVHPLGSADCLLAIACRSMPAAPSSSSARTGSISSPPAWPASATLWHPEHSDARRSDCSRIEFRVGRRERPDW
jgi:hypothetical protein